MIVFDPPPPPPQMRLITTKPHHQAVEMAIRIARLDFRCHENTATVEWLRILSEHDVPATFIIHANDDQVLTIEAIDGDDPGDVDVGQHQIVRGATGVLHLTALLSSLAAP